MINLEISTKILIQNLSSFTKKRIRSRLRLKRILLYIHCYIHIIIYHLVPVTGLEPVRGCPRGILSPLRLPIPPHRQIPEWMEVDSNHRSNLQQIYSLSPLATRESIHIKSSCIAQAPDNVKFYHISIQNASGN